MDDPKAKKPKWYRYYYIVCAILGLLGLATGYEGGNDLFLIVATGFFFAGVFGYYELKRYGR